mmetsp:Transcript_8526/g.17273  ORF Transcript_8526/g.17273 Transcript_8526/m.17273 type:complete len:303 (+) Transcript_8526:10333-11241(+)
MTLAHGRGAEGRYERTNLEEVLGDLVKSNVGIGFLDRLGELLRAGDECSRLLLHRLRLEVGPEAKSLGGDEGVDLAVKLPEGSEVVKHSSNGLKGVVGALQGILKLERLGLVKVDLLLLELGGVSLLGFLKESEGRVDPGSVDDEILLVDLLLVVANLAVVFDDLVAELALSFLELLPLPLLLLSLALLLLGLEPSSLGLGLTLPLGLGKFCVLGHKSGLKALNLCHHDGHGEKVIDNGLVATAAGEPKAVNTGTTLSLHPGNLPRQSGRLPKRIDAAKLHEGLEKVGVAVHGAGMNSMDSS